jgi:hypothetical protein
MPITNDTPEPIRVLLNETRTNSNGRVVWTERTAHFQQYIRSYNNSVAFTSFGAKLDQIVRLPILLASIQFNFIGLTTGMSETECVTIFGNGPREQSRNERVYLNLA